MPYITDRYAIRHEISKNIQFEYLESGIKYDMEYYCRPKDMKKAYEWCNTLNGGEYNYIKLLLDSLSMDKNYWLEYGY